MSAYLWNTWYLAAWSREVAPGQLLARTFLEEPVVIYRARDGAPTALADLCPHRFAPLSMGYQVEDNIRCAYHGLEFDKAGACARNPHGPIPKAAKVRRFPVIERYGAIWIWMGPTENADPDYLPDLSKFVGGDGQRFSRIYYHVDAHYELLSDNILDLSHIEYLHPGSFGTSAVADSTLEVIPEGETVRSRRVIRDDPLTPMMARHLGDSGQLYDRYLDVRWHAPATLTLDVNIPKAGEPETSGFTAPGAHIFTPERAGSTHYFMTGLLHGDEPEDGVPGEIDPIFAEDKPMLEGQQARIGGRDFWSLKPVLLSVDAAGVYARRQLQRMIGAEAPLI